MRSHRFTLNPEDQIIDQALEINNRELLHQLKHVLKLKRDSNIEVSFINGNGQILYADFISESKKSITFKIEKTENSKKELSQEVSFFVPIIKTDAFSLMIRQLTELGVKNFYPIIFERSQQANIKALSSENQIRRLNIIIKEATEQCEGAIFATLHKISKFNDLSEIVTDGIKLFASERLAESPETDLEAQISLMREVQKHKQINLLVGPEGGLSDHETAKLEELGFRALGLGSRLLKAETAALALMTSLCIQNNAPQY